MQIQKDGQAIRLTLTAREAYLLRRALERASLMDTPMNEQADIMAFCSRALEVIPSAPAS